MDTSHQSLSILSDVDEETKECKARTVEFIAKFEGFRAQAYWDVTRWSIGYGTKANGPDARISQEKAKRKLRQKVDKYFDRLQAQRLDAQCNQLIAMTSLAYNIGYPRWSRNFLNAWRNGDDNLTTRRIPMFRKANGQVLRGLEERRHAELLMFKNSSKVFLADGDI